MDSTIGYDDWQFAGILGQPDDLFVLWAIRAALCTTMDDFKHHFGGELPIETLVDKLVQLQLLDRHDAVLTLTDRGRTALSKLDHPSIVHQFQILNSAVLSYRDALTHVQRERSPTVWASTQYNLGKALVELARDVSREAKVAFLEEAIAAFRAAHTIYTQHEDPVRWKLIEDDLAGALGTHSSIAVDYSPVRPSNTLEPGVPESRLPGAAVHKDGDDVAIEVAQRTGISQDQAQQAVQTVVGFLKDRLPGPIASQLDNVLSERGASGGIGDQAMGNLRDIFGGDNS